MKETLEKYWRFVALALLPVGMWIASYFTGDRTPLWLCGVAVFGVCAIIMSIGAVKDDGLRFALWTSLAAFVVAHWVTNNRTFSLIFGLLIVLFYLALKWVDKVPKNTPRNSLRLKGLKASPLPGGKSIFPAVPGMKLPEYVGKRRRHGL